MVDILVYLAFIYGLFLAWGIHYFWNKRQQSKFPMKMIVFKEVGEGTPKAFVLEARIDGKYIVSKNQPGIGSLTKPRFQWDKQISDDIDVSLWRSNFNIYAVQIDETAKYKIQSKKTKIFNKNINMPYLVKHIIPKHVALKKKGEEPQYAKEEITKEGITYTSVNYNLFFPRTDEKLKSIIDDSIADVMIQLIEDTAERFTWVDRWEKFGTYVTMGAIVLVVVLFFVFQSQSNKNLMDALQKGVKVAVEIAMKAEPPIPTTIPPLPANPPPF